MTKAGKITYWIATLWLALGMTSTGLVQVLKVKSESDFMMHLGYPTYFMTILGTWKILGAIAVLVPKFPLVKEWAYAGFFFAMTGAIFSHIATHTVGQTFPSLLLLTLTVVSYYLRPADRRLVGSIMN